MQLTKRRLVNTNTAFALTFLAALVTIVRAELPPYVYKERQAKAPEALVVKIRAVRIGETEEPRRQRVDVTIEARVEQVTRSQTDLKPGAVIRIVYAHYKYKEPIAGPSEVPILEEGQTYPAYLTKEESTKTYAPAAGGYSFRTVK